MATDAERRLKEIRCLELAAAKVPYAKIATEVGYSNASGAYKAAMRALDRIEFSKVDELRKVELVTLDMLQRALMPFALAGDTKAVEKILKIQDRRAKYVPKLQVSDEFDSSSEGDHVSPHDFNNWIDDAWAKFQAEEAAKSPNQEMPVEQGIEA